MKYILLIGLILLAFCACDKAGDMRVLELDSGKFTVQLRDNYSNWDWIGNDGDASGDITYIQQSCKGLLVFTTENAACLYKEKFETLISIKRVIKCNPQEVE